MKIIQNTNPALYNEVSIDFWQYKVEVVEFRLDLIKLIFYHNNVSINRTKNTVSINRNLNIHGFFNVTVFKGPISSRELYALRLSRKIKESEVLGCHGTLSLGRH